jgi:hypothetical protein
MIVFLAGMMRSGSTFSFNVVRELLQRRGTVHQAATFDLVEMLGQAQDVNHLLMKSHSANEQVIRLARLGAIKVICTVRKPEDAIASSMEVFGFELSQAIDYMKIWLTMFRQVQQNALILSYDQIDRQPLRASWNIARHVCPEAGPREIFRIAGEFKKSKVKEFSEKLDQEDRNVVNLGFTYYDNQTFFHRRHVSSLRSRPATELLEANAIKLIRQGLAEHINSKGDLVIKNQVQ